MRTELKNTTRNLFFYGDVEEKIVSEISKEIILINEHDSIEETKVVGYVRKPINLYIDSFGGSLHAIFGLIAIVENSVTTVHTIVTGCAMSAGFLLLISGHKRFGYKYSTAMYHQLSYRQIGELKSQELRILKSKTLQALLEELTLNKTKLTKTDIEYSYERKEDLYFFGSEMLDKGIIDVLIN